MFIEEFVTDGSRKYLGGFVKLGIMERFGKSCEKVIRWGKGKAEGDSPVLMLLKESVRTGRNVSKFE